MVYVGSENAGLVIDTRQIGKPEKFSGKEEDWQEFKFTLGNFLACLHPKMPAVMDRIAKLEEPFQIPEDAPERDQRAIKILYAILSQLCRTVTHYKVRPVR